MKFRIPIPIRVALILLAVAIYFLAQHLVSDSARRTNVTSFSHNAMGLTYFVEWAKRRGLGIQIGQQAFLDDRIFANAHALVLASPSLEVSHHEMKFVEAMVANGGQLVLSAHTLQSIEEIKSIYKYLTHENLNIEEDPNFHNYELQKVKATKNLAFFKKDHTYTVYSAYRFPGSNCHSREIACFVKVAMHKAGRVIVVLGIPPLSNSLITETDNRFWGFALAENFSPIYVDEYHHFFSDRTFFDMLKRPSFALFLVGVFVLTLLYFLFGHTSFVETSQLDSPHPSVRSYHQLNENLLLRVIGESNQYDFILRNHLNLLYRAFPQDKTILEDLVRESQFTLQVGSHKSRFLAEAKKLIAIHRALKERKGKKW